MKKRAILESNYNLSTLFYRASIYARNRYLMRKHRLQIQYYGLLLKYSLEEINRHIEEQRRTALNTRRRKKKAGMKYPLVQKAEKRQANF